MEDLATLANTQNGIFATQEMRRFLPKRYGLSRERRTLRNKDGWTTSVISTVFKRLGY